MTCSLVFSCYESSMKSKNYTPGQKRRKHSKRSRLAVRLGVICAVLNPLYGRKRLDDYRARLRGTLPSGAETGDLIVAACDDVYFKIFGKTLVSSFAALPGSHSIHLLLLEPSAETVKEAEELCGRYPNVQLTFSIDDCADASPLNEKPLYYTAARFILAPLLLERGIRRILLIDVDSIAQKSPWPIIDRLPDDSSVAMGFRLHKGDAWQKVLAGAVLYCNDDVSRLFADRFGRALLQNVSRPRDWYVDQMIPYYLTTLSSRKTKLRIKPIPSEVLSLDFDENAALWTAKGTKKYSEQFSLAQADFEGK